MKIKKHYESPLINQSVRKMESFLILFSILHNNSFYIILSSLNFNQNPDILLFCIFHNNRLLKYSFSSLMVVALFFSHLSNPSLKTQLLKLFHFPCTEKIFSSTEHLFYEVFLVGTTQPFLL